jgi:post-segregation antitoxin (ccd killing protein)
MGSRIYVPKRSAGVVTTVRIDIDLYIKAQKKGINISEVTRRALKALLRDDDLTEEQVAALLAERSRRIDEAVTADTTDTKETIEAVLTAIQPTWNAYLAAAPDAVRESRLAWVEGKRERNPILRGLTAEAILAELEGT